MPGAAVTMGARVRQPREPSSWHGRRERRRHRDQGISVAGRRDGKTDCGPDNERARSRPFAARRADNSVLTGRRSLDVYAKEMGFWRSPPSKDSGDAFGRSLRTPDRLARSPGPQICRLRLERRATFSKPSTLAASSMNRAAWHAGINASGRSNRRAGSARPAWAPYERRPPCGRRIRELVGESPERYGKDPGNSAPQPTKGTRGRSSP